MIVVNLFGGPSSGKSTTAAGVMAALKLAGVMSELVGEDAKWAAWAGIPPSSLCQPQFFGNQLYRMCLLAKAGVDVAICDSPLLLSLIYGRDQPKCFFDLVRYWHDQWHSLNFVIERAKPFDQRGRYHSEGESRLLDVDIAEMLLIQNIKATGVPGDPDCAAKIAGQVLATFIDPGVIINAADSFAPAAPGPRSPGSCATHPSEHTSKPSDSE